MYGELVPIGGGDPIPLLKSNLVVGRRESCDIVLRFGNVSGQHCELNLDRGWWFVKDSNSQNGTRVNGLRVSKKRLDPGDRLTIARHDYEVRYSPAANGGDETTPPEDDVFSDIMGRSLLESAGLDRRKFHEREGRIGVRRKSAANGSPGASAASDAAEQTIMQQESAAEQLLGTSGGSAAGAPAPAPEDIDEDGPAEVEPADDDSSV
jgi:adenylate cyclase